jgi:protein-S-isoprenylcysteine O-methyltransferase Ste14
MDSLHILQKITLAIYTANVVFLFFYSWWKRKKISFGSFETTILPLAIILYLVFKLDFPFSNNIFLLVLGLGLYVGGSILGKIAFNNLGWVNSDDFWFARSEKKQRYLATTGPYRYFRHPIFISITISYLGLALVFFHAITITLWILAFIFVVVTSLNEEKFMQSKFPEYKEYMKRTGRFFPKILK